MECGYIEAGVATEQPNACPQCGAPSQALEFFPDEDGEPGSDGQAPEDAGDVFEHSVDPDEDDIRA